MKNTKTTKRAWLASVLSLLLCISMLIGSTFAWFTDSATTGVNKIQAGTLDVVLEMWDGTKWVDANGGKLAFIDKDANALWEPGCTYTLQDIRIRNAGNLHLKYYIAITGIDGDAKLNEAIEWSYNNGTALSNLVNTDNALAPGDDSGAITIQGHMKKEAGNEYQGLSIDNIAITVYATQYTAEYDSNGNTYDKEATYPSILKDLSLTVDITGKVGADNKLTEAVVITDAASGVTVTLPVGTLIEANTTKLTLNIKEDYVSNNVTLGITAGYDVSVSGVASGNTAPIVVYMPKVMPAAQTAIQLFHEGTLMEQVDTVAAVSEANSQNVYGDRFYYNSANGDVTYSMTHFSNVSIASSDTVTVDGADLTGFTTINLNNETGDVKITADQKVILTWNSGTEGTFNALTANPITAIFTNETPNPGNYYSGTITVETGATVVLNGVNIRTDGTKDALSIYDTGINGTTTTIYVADGTRNYLVGRCGIGVDTTGTTTWGNDIVLEGGGFLCATAMQNGCPAIGPSAWNSLFDITIDVGHLRAHPHKNAAGIGGGSSWRGFGDITIEGGIIQAYSGGNAASIGSGVNGDTGSITVKAGTVNCYNQPWTATHYAMGAGTYEGECSSIVVADAATVYTNSYGAYSSETDTIKKSGFKANHVYFGIEIAEGTEVVVPDEASDVQFGNTKDDDGAYIPVTIENETIISEYTVTLGGYTSGRPSGDLFGMVTTMKNVTIKDNAVDEFGAGWHFGNLIYGTATLENCTITGTTIAADSTSPNGTVTDLGIFNYSKATITGGTYGTIDAWNHTNVTVTGAKVNAIYSSSYAAGDTEARKANGLTIGNGSTVVLVKAGCRFAGLTSKQFKIVIESGAKVDTLDLTGVDLTASKTVISIADGATVGKIIVSDTETYDSVSAFYAQYTALKPNA